MLHSKKSKITLNMGSAPVAEALGFSRPSAVTIYFFLSDCQRVIAIRFCMRYNTIKETCLQMAHPAGHI